MHCACQCHCIDARQRVSMCVRACSTLFSVLSSSLVRRHHRQLVMLCVFSRRPFYVLLHFLTHTPIAFLFIFFLWLATVPLCCCCCRSGPFIHFVHLHLCSFRSIMLSVVIVLPWTNIAFLCSRLAATTLTHTHGSSKKYGFNITDYMDRARCLFYCQHCTAI